MERTRSGCVGPQDWLASRAVTSEDDPTFSPAAVSADTTAAAGSEAVGVEVAGSGVGDEGGDVGGSTPHAATNAGRTSQTGSTDLLPIPGIPSFRRTASAVNHRRHVAGLGSRYGPADGKWRVLEWPIVICGAIVRPVCWSPVWGAAGATSWPSAQAN
jgi:hypothetical protein